MKGTDRRPPRVMAVASGGGHWVELRRIRPAWEGCAVTWVTTQAGYGAEVAGDAAGDGPPARFLLVPDATRWDRLRLLAQAVMVALAVLRVRPDTVVTTGAAPGYFALRFGRMLGARTIWVDSIANAAELSMAGRMAGRHADLWLTQWPDLADPEGGGPDYRGAVL